MTSHLVSYFPIDTLKIIDAFLCPLKKHHTPNNLARNGCLDGLRWIHKYRPQSFEGQKPMLLASQHGFLHIVQWLHSKGYFDHDAITYAARLGHSSIIHWLRYKQYPVHQTSILSALEYRHYDLARYLLCEFIRDGHTLQTTDSLKAIARNGFVPAFDWFVKHFHTRITHKDACSLITLSVRNGHFSMTRLLHQRYDARPILFSIDYAIRRGALEVVQYCLENNLDELSEFSVNDAVVNGHSEIVQYLNPRTIQNWAFNIACSKGHFRMIKWIYYNYPRCVNVKETLYLMRTKMNPNPNPDVMGWLLCLA